MINKDISAQLSKIPYFEKLDPKHIFCINEAALYRTFEEGQQVFLEGDPCVGLYIVEIVFVLSIILNGIEKGVDK